MVEPHFHALGRDAPDFEVSSPLKMACASHGSIQMTQRYAHWENEALQRARA
ncbi:hypothetical protein LJC46_09015 [Desulfovibrio sp. OttesenSCG-928-G15]|nr:hypothetical protein [Desulfovibrio sp. OttesenSCG-928-G15]